jgi:hypothetical protein
MCEGESGPPERGRKKTRRALRVVPPQRVTGQLPDDSARDHGTGHMSDLDMVAPDFHEAKHPHAK